MPDAAIALGSNLGDRAANLHLALQHLGRLGKVTAVSTFHDTSPEGLIDQPRFLNAAALLDTMIPAEDLLLELLAVEGQMGRLRGEGVPDKGPRLIDLDLLLYDQLILTTKALTLPHPEMHRRQFVLAPLAEIAPDWIHPLSGIRVGSLLDSLQA